ncbi:MAG TPA: CDP-archaeol synthase [Vicinamibacterales bacterium]|jgi:CDP-2,3-bis-(O-geranylgeranyl)-sn-glycerol synthase
MKMNPLTAPVDAGSVALFLMAAFVLAGCAQVVWLASRFSHRLSMPLDGGRTFRGRRIFGANKTLRGFVVMVPAAAAAFAIVAAGTTAAAGSPESAGLWPLTIGGYALLGAWAGLGFMLGELPNSFVKRQLGIAPGAIATRPLAAAWQFSIDRIDSGLGMLTALSLAVPTPWQTWALVILIGWTIHWSFSVVLFRLRVKPRPA